LEIIESKSKYKTALDKLYIIIIIVIFIFIIIININIIVIIDIIILINNNNIINCRDIVCGSVIISTKDYEKLK